MRYQYELEHVHGKKITVQRIRGEARSWIVVCGYLDTVKRYTTEEGARRGTMEIIGELACNRWAVTDVSFHVQKKES